MTAQAIADRLYALYGLHITSQTVDKIYERGIWMLKPTQDRYVREIEKSNIVILDETTFKGEPKRWIGACRNEDTVAYVHAHKHNVKDLLSQMQNCKGIPIHDGYSGYNSLFKDKNIQQRCTQHLTRAAKNTAIHTKLKTANNLYREISLMFILPRKWTKGGHSAQEHTDLVSKLEKWMRHIISRYRKSPNELMKKCGNTFANAFDHMPTFVIYSFAPSTTNLIEQSIRKVIGHRNNRIQLKNDTGADKLCTLLTCIETWKLRKLNVWEELGKRICSSPKCN